MLIALLIFFPMLAAPLLYALGGRRERTLDGAAAACTGAEALLSLALLFRQMEQAGGADPVHLAIPAVFGDALRFLPDGLGAVYGLLASLLWLGSALFSVQYFLREREHMRSYWFFQLFTLGAVQGVFLSEDFMTAFLFFEILSLSSFPWVMHERTPEAIRAGKTYLAVAIVGGLILFFGLLLLADSAGTLRFNALPRAAAAADRTRLRAAGVCILLGFGAKAGMFPLHVWLPKAHPVAPAPSSALLSGMLTKIGIFGIFRLSVCVLPEDGFFGKLLLVLALITTVLGAILALSSDNLKRTLACSSMSQIGFILTGLAACVLCRAAGEAGGAEQALSGTVLHMVDHSLFKLALFLCAGAAAMDAHTLDLTRLRGWGRRRPVTAICFAAAALGISGVPLFAGYLSKTLLHEGLVEAVHAAGIWGGAEWIFLCSGGLTFAYMLRLFFCLFLSRNVDPVLQRGYDGRGEALTPLSRAVLLSAAALLLPLGAPPVALALAKRMTGEGLGAFAAFSAGNLKGSAISLGIGAALYLAAVRGILARGGRERSFWPEQLDLEELVYRPLLLRWLPGALGALVRLFAENALLRPLCRALVWLGSVFGRALETVSDALVLLAVRTVLHEEPVRNERSLRRGPLRWLEQGAGNAMQRILDNFSYAMMMACVGVILILGLLIFFT